MSKSHISTDEIKHLAKLANIQVDESQLKTYADQMQEIVGFVEQLDEVEVGDTDPTYQINDGVVNVFREDEITPSLSQQEALSQAKRTHQGYFVVDGVLYE